MRKAAVWIVMLFLLCGFACLETASAEAYVPVTGVSVENASLELVCNDPEKNTWAVVPSFEPEGASVDERSVVSNNPKGVEIVDVVDGHLIRAVGQGEARVTVTANVKGAKKSPQCVIKVKVTKRVTGIDVAGDHFNVPVKGTLQLPVQVEPADATNKKLAWKSSDETVATVNSSGMVRGMEAGEVTVTAAAADGSGTVKEIAVSVIQPVTAVKTLSGYHQGMVWDIELNKTIPISNAFAVEPGNASNKELDFTVYLDGRVTESGYVLGKNEAYGWTELTFTEPGLYYVEATSKDGSDRSAKIKIRIYSKDLMTLDLNKARWSPYANDTLGVSFEIRNREYGIGVETVELYVYAEDAQGNKIGEGVYPAATKEIEPGHTVYSEYVYLPDRSSIARVYCGIHEVKYTDPRMPVRTCEVDYHMWEYK